MKRKRHLNTAHSENSKHSSYAGTMFARSTIRHLMEVAGFLAPKEVVFHSQDDKTKAPIGLTTANTPVPLVMHVEYKVKLPDYDFVIANQHKLVPPLIGDMQVKAITFSSDAVTYSGLTYVGIRSAKHLGLSAYSHLADMKRIRELPVLAKKAKNAI